jgi:hypothetical protein
LAGIVFRASFSPAQVMVFVHSRRDTAKTAQFMRTTAQNEVPSGSVLDLVPILQCVLSHRSGCVFRCSFDDSWLVWL